MRDAPSATSLPPASRSALLTAFATIYLVWGSTYLANRVAIESMPPFLMAGLRFVVAGLALLTWVKLKGTPWPTRTQWRDNLLIAVLLLVGGTGLVVWSQQYIPSGLTALIIGASPLFFALVEWAWPGGVAPNALTWVALITGFGGVAWLAAPWETAAAGGLRPWPTAVILLGSISWAIGSIYSRHVRHRAPALLSAAIQMVAGGAALMVAAGLHGEFARFDPSHLTVRSSAALAYLIVVGSLVAFPTFLWLTQRASPARVSTYAYVNPVVAVTLGWIILDEPVGPRTWVSAVVILAAVALITAQRSRPGRTAQTAASTSAAGRVRA